MEDKRKTTRKISGALKQTINLTEEEKKSLSKKVSGGLRQCIHAHGPITKELVGSATKRIVGNLKVNPNQIKVDNRISIKTLLIGVCIGITITLLFL